MKSGFIVVGAIIAAAVFGFWSGFYCSRQLREENIEKQIAADLHGHYRYLASENTRVLQYLADGEQSKARGVLERELDASVINIVLYWQSFGGGVHPAWDCSVVRRARDYRSHHPWVEQGQRTDALQHAFNWAE